VLVVSADTSVNGEKETIVRMSTTAARKNRGVGSIISPNYEFKQTTSEDANCTNIEPFSPKMSSLEEKQKFLMFLESNHPRPVLSRANKLGVNLPSQDQ